MPWLDESDGLSDWDRLIERFAVISKWKNARHLERFKEKYRYDRDFRRRVVRRLKEARYRRGTTPLSYGPICAVHGTNHGYYTRKCRCAACKEYNSNYRRELAKRHALPVKRR